MTMSLQVHRGLSSRQRFNAPIHYRDKSHVIVSTRRHVCCASSKVDVLVKPQELEYETDKNGLQRLKFNEQGWNFWEWQGKRVHYVQAGEQGSPVVLVHGYGASAYHWRYNIPELAKTHRVFAVDMLGFGWSEKAPVDYSNGRVWVQQISDFIKEKVGGEPVVLVGNSLGGYASMATAAEHPDLVRGVALLNGAGPFDDEVKQSDMRNPSELSLWDSLKGQFISSIKRVVLLFAFIQAKQPGRIREVLGLVYACKDNVDDDLVTSIQLPAADPAASDVFFRINNRTSPPITVNNIVSKLRAPMLLLWGDLDPWMVPARAEKIMKLYPAAEKVSLQSGHCPHDDTPVEANNALVAWLRKLDA